MNVYFMVLIYCAFWCMMVIIWNKASPCFVFLTSLNMKNFERAACLYLSLWIHFHPLHLRDLCIDVLQSCSFPPDFGKIFKQVSIWIKNVLVSFPRDMFVLCFVEHIVYDNFELH